MTTTPAWPETFGGRLKLARKARGFRRQEDLADALGVSLKTINRHETSAEPPSKLQSIKAYTQALGVTEAWLLYGIGDGPEMASAPKAVLDYLRAPPLGGPVSSAVTQSLLATPWDAYNCPDPTLEEVHKVRIMIESLVDKRMRWCRST